MTKVSRYVRQTISILIRFLLPLVILAGGVLLAKTLIDTGPKARREAPPRQARIVEVLQVDFSAERVVVEAMGTVQPSRSVELYPRVSGEITYASDNLIPGGYFRGGQIILKIDPSDYELAVTQRASDVARAESSLKLELGQQSIAEREYELLGETISEEDRELVLRIPQLESVRAELEKARSSLEKAKLDLARTDIKAPFNAIIKSRDVNLGASVTQSTRLATLVDADEYWVNVLVPVDQLKWIRIPDSNESNGSKVRIFNEPAWGKGISRKGVVVGMAGDLEEQGRMSQLLISVKDPLAMKEDQRGSPPMIIDSYVRVEIEGKVLNPVAVVDRRLIRDGNTVWIMDQEDRLEIRKVEVAFRGRDRVFVSRGLSKGEKVVVTDLAAPVEGMPLRSTMNIKGSDDE